MLSSLFKSPLFSLQIPSSARDQKQILGGFIDRQGRSRSRSLADLFEKNEEKKNICVHATSLGKFKETGLLST